MSGLKAQLQLRLKQSLQLRLTPQLQLAMKMLQMNHLELAEVIKQEIEQNPLLESPDNDQAAPDADQVQLDASPAAAGASVTYEAEGGEGTGVGALNAGPGLDKHSKSREMKEDFQDAWLKYQVDNQDNMYSESQGVVYSDPEEESNIEEYVSTKPSLTDHLSMQLRLSSLQGLGRKVGEYLLGLIDRNGYLNIDEESVLATLGISRDVLDNAVSVVQTFDPPGIAARNLTECLLLQYQARADRKPLVENIIRIHLEDLAANRLKLIAAKEKASLEDVLEAYREIKRLDPKPGLHFDLQDKPQYITPDVFVEEVNGQVEVRLNEKYVPQLRINNFYRSQLRLGKLANKSTVQYIRDKLNAARFVIESIERRKTTIYNVAKRIFEIQSGFLHEGVKGLKPLTLKQVADFVSLHESTISRVTNSKWVHTPRGVFQLKFFFSSGTTTDSGESVSSKHVHELLLEMVSKEDPKRPHSDAKLASMFKAKGIDIARRTITKYREELNIRSSSRRKQFS